MSKQRRGTLDDNGIQTGLSLLGRLVTTRELRLLPYIQYCVLNDRRIDSRKINKDEVEIINDWTGAGWIMNPYNDLTVTYEFWKAMCELIWSGYVVSDDKEEYKWQMTS
jgi:hypothetical protein